MIKKNKGFTLSEILIALGVIGVVASLILPQLILGQKSVTAKSQFNTAYSTLTQAVTNMEADNRLIKASDVTDGTPIYERFKEYSRVTIDCGSGNSPANTSVCPSATDYKDLKNKPLSGLNMEGAFVMDNGMMVALVGHTTIEIEQIPHHIINPPEPHIPVPLTNIFGNYFANLLGSPAYAIEGTTPFEHSYQFENNPIGNWEVSTPETTVRYIKTRLAGVYLMIDTNGKNKLPNRLGYDVFMFMLASNGELNPVGAPNTGSFAISPERYCCNEQVNPGCSASSENQGYTCGFFAITDNDYFRKLYKNH